MRLRLDDLGHPAVRFEAEELDLIGVRPGIGYVNAQPLDERLPILLLGRGNAEVLEGC